MTIDKDITEKVRDAVRLRAEGLTYEAIGEALNIGQATAFRYVEKGLIATIREPSEIIRQTELRRLDTLMIKSLEVLNKNHVSISQGRVVREIIGQEWSEEADRMVPIYGDPIIDDAPVLDAVKAILKVMERRAKLLGLDAPTKVETWTIDAMTARIDELKKSLARNDGPEMTRLIPE